MGNLATPEALIARWEELCRDPSLQAETDEKRSAYLAAGATEVWLVSDNGGIRYFGPAGEKARSDFPASLELPPPIPAKP
jgi:hypothetical protein